MNRFIKKLKIKYGSHQIAEILLSIGGDGTLLDTITLIRNSGINVLGINLGRLGFLSSISKDEILPAIDKVLSGNFVLEQRTLLELSKPEAIFGLMHLPLLMYL